MSNLHKDLMYKNYDISLSYEEAYHKYLIKVSGVGKGNLLFFATEEDYTRYGEESVLDRAIGLYRLRSEIIEQIG